MHELRLTPEEQRHVLGSQANLWTEYVPDTATAEYMLLPRLCALAEVMWCAPDSRSWPDFCRRLLGHVPLWERMSFNYRPLDPDVVAAGGMQQQR